MKKSECGEVTYRQGLRVVRRLLRDAVWAMEGTEDVAQALDALIEGLRVLRLPVESCGIYEFDPGEDPPPVVCRYSWTDGRWRQSVAGVDRDAAISVWRSGAVARFPNLEEGDSPGKGQGLAHVGEKVARSAVEAPFANGVLSVASSKTDAFAPRHIQIVKELAEALEDLFCRLNDLRELESRELQLERAQRMAMIGDLAASTAHEASNALTVILGQCELLLFDELDASVRESLEEMLGAGEHARSIVARLLALAKSQQPRKQLTDMNELVSDTLGLLRRQCDRDDIQLCEDLESGLPLVEAQPGLIRQVIINLVKNSREAIGSGTSRGCIVVRTRHADRQVRVEVEDDGPGIPESTRGRVFDAFYTTKDDGTGLGLSVSQTIARSHGGSLFAAPRGRGTLIVLALPGVDPSAMAALS